MKLTKRLEIIRNARDNSKTEEHKPAVGEAVFNLATTTTTTPGENGSLTKLSFAGYSGQPVNLSDYGVKYPMIYSLSGITYKNSVPILYEHWEPIGHSTTISKTDTNLSGEGVTSFPSSITDTVVQAIKNGFPFEASMGLRIPNQEDITFLEKGQKRVINNREVTGPMYVAERSVLKEMTVTMSGRDSNTSFGLLNKEAITMLLNSAPPVTPAEPPATPPVVPPAPAAVPPVVPPVAPVQNSVPPVAPAPVVIPVVAPTPVVQNSGNRSEIVQISLLMNKYPKYLPHIEKCLDDGHGLEAIENSIKLDMFNNNLPQVPNLTPGNRAGGEGSNILAHFALSCGIRPETLEKHGIDKKSIDVANNGPRWGFIETLVNIANSAETSKRFGGFSDVEFVCEAVKNSARLVSLNINNAAAYSTIDMPNLLKKTTDMMMEERWEINPPFATRYLKEESNKDFRETQRFRPGGGKIWDEVQRDGKLEMTDFGKETEYRSKLSTSGQVVVFNREQIYNDDMGVISDMLVAMVEGALIVPDMKLGKLMLVEAPGAGLFWVAGDNSRTTFGLNRANLSTAYTALRTYDEERGKKYVNLINDRWTLITSITGEEAAWDILQQGKIVQETGAPNGTKTGDKNFWFGKLDQAVFPQMSNSSLLGSGTFVSEATWLLWPSSQRYSPYSITYLRGQRRPIVESIDLPGNMLGSGVRGYWDVEINRREREAIGRFNG
jgi:hypothetical protein